MSLFRTKYERDKLTRQFSPTGSGIYEKKGWIYEDGDLKWITKEKENVYAKIQAEKDAVELHAILKRYEDGDDSALNKVEGMYMDTVDLPKNYAELYSAVSRADDIFYNMPTEIREKYNNNAATFWRNYGTEAFDDLVNAYRSDIYHQYGMVDESPVNTVRDYRKDREKVRKQLDQIDADEMSIVKEVTSDEQKSE